MRRLGLVAQLVEQRIENPCVGGSIPPRATKNSAVQQNANPFGLALSFPGSAVLVSSRRSIYFSLFLVRYRCRIAAAGIDFAASVARLNRS
jgi:hypothetical protein